MGYRTFIVLVREWDFETDEGQYEPTTKEMGYLFRPFTVLAYDTIDALNRLSDRVGWCIKDAEFLSV